MRSELPKTPADFPGTEADSTPHSITASTANASVFLQTALSDLLRALSIYCAQLIPRSIVHLN